MFPSIVAIDACFCKFSSIPLRKKDHFRDQLCPHARMNLWVGPHPPFLPWESLKCQITH